MGYSMAQVVGQVEHLQGWGAGSGMAITPFQLDPCPGACFPTGEFGQNRPTAGATTTRSRMARELSVGGHGLGRQVAAAVIGRRTGLALPGRRAGSSPLRRQGPGPGSAPSRRSGVERVDELADLLPGSGHGGSRLPATVRTAVGTAVAAAGGGGVRPRPAPRRRRSPAEPHSPGRRHADGRTRRRPRRSRQHPTPLPGPRPASRSTAASRRTIASRSPRETVRGPISKAGRSGLARSDASTGPGNRSGTPVVRLRRAEGFVSRWQPVAVARWSTIFGVALAGSSLARSGDRARSGPRSRPRAIASWCSSSHRRVEPQYR